MAAINECLGCGVDFDHSDGDCPECGWSPAEFSERGRYGLAKEGHGEPEDGGDADRDGAGDDRDGGSRGPPPGPKGLLGF
ncbi:MULTISPECIES: hypothetical protein [Halobaculum]|uniref:Uncharacterized protein n=2 Tax=Halobaculum TaxID=43927 RepID=A0A8T8WBT7_9EURY|nr:MULTISPECIES: hypothetical protein [Halobaculum]QZP37204.1 hypothetical protein K6T50_13055 [Halobaculum magnesiiphilum]QZY02204.1 hypothetical protein K6T36_12970 [Halobaculum roseum]